MTPAPAPQPPRPQPLLTPREQQVVLQAGQRSLDNLLKGK